MGPEETSVKIEVTRFRESDIDTVFEIQRTAFRPLYEKYRDSDTSPYKERKETILRKYTKAGTSGYLFFLDKTAVGAVRIHVDEAGRSGRVSALCVLPRYQGRGIAQAALLEIERRHPDVERWFLDTILEEAGSCHLYEKIGYEKTGEMKAVNEKMTLVFYEKTRT